MRKIKETDRKTYGIHRITLSGFGVFLCICALLVLSSCGRDDDTVILEDQEEFNSEERKMMSSFLEQAISESSTFDIINPQATSEMAAFYEYLNRNYQSMVNTEQVVNRNKFNWNIYVLNDEESKNTFITPGGAMYITTGMLKTIDSEHELINILAHEISYADRGVVLEKLKSDYGGTVLFKIINGLNPGELPVIAEELKNIKYSESEVLDADSYAVDIICDFLYDPHGMRDFLKRISSTEETLDWMENRPSTEDRWILVEQGASGCGPGRTFEERYQDFLKKLQ